jgi:transcriptional regulator with XRE-family HTH domain
MAFENATVHSSYRAVVNGQILSGTLFPEVALTTNTAAQTEQPYRWAVRVYHSAFGSLQATANTTLTFWDRLIQTDVGLSQVTLIKTPTIVRHNSFQVRSALHELRRLSGFTWDDLADVLGVTRRSLHLWANGASISSPNEKHVRDLLVAMQALDRSTATENRQLLLAPVRDGKTVSDFLRNREFNDVVALVGRGHGRQTPVRPDVIEAALQAERVSIVDMLGTNPERIHVDDGRYLPSRRRAKRV